MVGKLFLDGGVLLGVRLLRFDHVGRPECVSALLLLTLLLLLRSRGGHVVDLRLPDVDLLIRIRMRSWQHV